MANLKAESKIKYELTKLRGNSKKEGFAPVSPIFLLASRRKYNTRNPDSNSIIEAAPLILSS